MKSTRQVINIISNRYEESEKYVRNFDLNNYGCAILDAGAGQKRARVFINNNKYVSQDFGEYKGGGVYSDYKGTWDKPWDSSDCDLLCDICDIPISDNSFDMVICFEVIEHLQEPLNAIKELSRVLKKDGILILTAPNLCAAHQKPHYYYSGFSNEFFTSAVIQKCKVLSLEFLGIEGNFINAHSSELLHLIACQKNRVTRSLVYLFTKLVRGIFKLLQLIPGFKMPESCSGFFIVYKKSE